MFLLSSPIQSVLGNTPDHASLFSCCACLTKLCPVRVGTSLDCESNDGRSAWARGGLFCTQLIVVTPHSPSVCCNLRTGASPMNCQQGGGLWASLWNHVFCGILERFISTCHIIGNAQGPLPLWCLLSPEILNHEGTTMMSCDVSVTCPCFDPS